MKNKKLGNQTVVFSNPPTITAWADVAGKKENEGPLRGRFDFVSEDTTFGEKSWEKAESRMQTEALRRAAAKAGTVYGSIDYILAGDLLNQCIGTSFGLRECQIPLFGLYGACSTMAESLGLAAMLIDGEFASTCAAMTSSHFCSAERQYRTPLEYGGQRTPSAQWTVTGSGCVILGDSGAPPYVTHVTTGKITDLGIKDAANMGAAMAPAAISTLGAFFSDTGTKPSDYDLIVTGDLGRIGHSVVTEDFEQSGNPLGSVYNDCGLMIFDPDTQDVHSGGSGCACSALVLCSHILPSMQSGQLRRVLFAGTGALLSPASTQQGESIPSVCHLVCLSSQKGS